MRQHVHKHVTTDELVPPEGNSSFLLVSGVNLSLTDVWRFGDLKQHRSRLQVSDFESREVDAVDVVLRFAQIVWMETENTLIDKHSFYNLIT